MDIVEQLEMMSKSGMGKAILDNFKPTEQMCITCGANTPILDLYTGEAWQRMCPECRKKYRDLAKVVCKKCSHFLGFMKSGVTPDGYYVKPDETLHAEFCHLCSESLARSKKAAPILEFERHASVKRGNAMAKVIEAGAHRGELG